jgi:NitT/TauT family transport system permease protein
VTPARLAAIRLTVARTLLYAAILGIWEVLTRVGVIDAFFFPAPSKIAGVLGVLLGKGDVFRESAVTLVEMSVGLVVGSVAGISAGLLLVRWPPAERVASPLVSFLYTMPRIALAPLFIVAFGLGTVSKIATVIFSVFFILLISTTAGARNVSADYIRGAQALGATPSQVTWKVLVPGTFAWIFSALRLAVSQAFLTAVVAEFVGATGGLGYRLQIAAVYFNTAEIFAWLFVLGIFAVMVSAVVGVVERRALRWRA